MKEVNEATDYAENAPYAAPEDALKHVYAEKDGGTHNGSNVLYRCNHTCNERRNDS